MYQYNGKLKERAEKLRKEMTPSERKLWYLYLEKHRIRFQRQKMIGNYIVDFYCHRANIVVEVDGSQHYEEDAAEYDQIRSAYLACLGIEVIRFTNEEVANYFESVCNVIEQKLALL